MSNVIIGPWLKAATPPQTLEDVEESIALVRTIHVQEIVSTVAGEIFEMLELVGIDIFEDEVYTKDKALIAESIRSVVMRRYGQYHPMQQISDAVFEWTDNGLLRTLDTLNLEFEGNVEQDC